VSKDHSLYIRYALVAQLKSLAVNGVADRWYPQQVPANQAYPYGFVGVPITTPDQVQCWDNSTTRFAIHAYTQSETDANKIGQRLAQMDGYSIDLTADPVNCPYPAVMDLTWISSTPTRDAQESTIFHLISQWQADVSA
jgi:hypothetical protein